MRKVSGRAIPVRDVSLATLVRVRPGGRIPLDGIVENGHGTVDQSPVTGESIPVDKKPGDPVFAGTINESGMIEFAVTALASDTVVAGSSRQLSKHRKPVRRPSVSSISLPLSIRLWSFCSLWALPS